MWIPLVSYNPHILINIVGVSENGILAPNGNLSRDHVEKAADLGVPYL